MPQVAPDPLPATPKIPGPAVEAAGNGTDEVDVLEFLAGCGILTRSCNDVGLTVAPRLDIKVRGPSGLALPLGAWMSWASATRILVELSSAENNYC